MCDVLGYERYGAAGGDWGAIVTGDLAHSQPERLAGAWLILPSIPGVNLRTIPPGAHAEDEQWMLAQMEAVRSTTTTHWRAQMQERQTLAYALVDSPVGTGAWIWSRRRD
jgi:hypothetical protein